MTDTLTTTSIFFLGCLHALEPGHGKTFLLAYTVGGQLNFKKILLLALSLLFSHFVVLSVISIIFNILITEFENDFIHEFSHLIGPSIIIIFGAFILGRAIYKKKHLHSDQCGHEHGKFSKSRIKSPITVGLLTGMLPCASSLAVVMMTGMNPSLVSILRFILVYVFGIAVVLFLVVIIFNITKNIVVEKFGDYSRKINPEIVSGCLIILVGFGYLSYNWIGHSH